MPLLPSELESAINGLTAVIAQLVAQKERLEAKNKHLREAIARLKANAVSTADAASRATDLDKIINDLDTLAESVRATLPN